MGVQEKDSAVLFWVTDSGPGIAVEHLPHVFERFWQARKDAAAAQALACRSSRVSSRRMAAESGSRAPPAAGLPSSSRSPSRLEPRLDLRCRYNASA